MMNAHKDIEIDLLRCFQEVVLSGSFTLAADRLFLTQAAVSQKVKRLEALTGRQLLMRNSRSLLLTQAGESLLAYAQSLTALHQQMQDWLAGPVLAGKLMLGVAEHTALLHLARMLSAFRRLFPKVELYVEVGMSEVLLKKLQKGVLDLVIAQPYADMEYQAVLSREKMVWVAGLNYLPQLDKPLPLALLPEPCSYRNAGLGGLESQGIKYQIVVTCTSLAGVQNLVAGNLAVSVLTKDSVTAELQVLGPASGLPKLPGINTCLFKSPKSKSPVTEPFGRFLTEQFNKGAGGE
jgi:DNA-binding transcriptional LysR family regulator